MRLAGPDGRREGVQMAQELLLALRPLVQGVYLMPSFGRYEVAAEVLEVLEAETAAALVARQDALGIHWQTHRRPPARWERRRARRSWRRAASRRRRCSAEPILRRVWSTASGLTEIESMPKRTSCSAYSGWTDGACPQIEDLIPARAAAGDDGAGSCPAPPRSRSSKSGASGSLSRSTPSTSCVRSFEPIETPSTPARAYSSSQYDDRGHLGHHPELEVSRSAASRLASMSA